MDLVADRFLRSADGRWIDLATAEEVDLVLTPRAAAAGSGAAWLARCDAQMAGGDAGLIDYGCVGSAARFEARRLEPTRSVWVDTLSTPRDCRAERTRFAQVADARPRYGSLVPTTRLRPHAGGPDDGIGSGDATRTEEVVHEIVDRIEHGRVAGWDEIRMAVDARDEARIAAAVARDARLRGYVPLGVETCRQRPHVVGLVGDAHVLLIVGRTAGTASGGSDLALLRALIALGWSSGRPHLLLRFVGEAWDLGRRGAAWRVAEAASAYAAPSGGQPGCGETETAVRAPADAVRAGGEAVSAEGASSEAAPTPVEVTPAASEAALQLIDERSAALRSTAERGLALARLGRHAPAERMLREAVQALVRRACHAAAGGLALDLGRLLLAQGKTKEAVRAYEDARQAFERVGHRGGLVEAAVGTGTAWTDEGWLLRAEGVLRAAQVAAETAGDERGAGQAARALARVRYWQGRFSEALTLLAVPGLNTSSGRAADLCLRAQCQLALAEVGEAGRFVAAALEELELEGDARVAAEAHTIAVVVQGVVGDRAAAKRHAARALVEARRARSWPLAFEARLALFESLTRLGCHRDLRPLGRRLSRYQAARLPQLWRIRLQRALGAAGSDAAASRMRSDAVRFIQVNGVGGLDGSRRERPAMDVLQDVIDVMRICHEVDDERAALARVCSAVRERSRALTVGFFPADQHDAPLSFAGSAPRGRHQAARRAIETGMPIPPARYGTTIEAAAPVRYGGQTVAALAGRWAGDVPIGSERATALLAAAATASAPGVRAALDRRAAPAPAGDPASVELIGESDAMAALRQQIARAAPAPFGVLIEGESGSGKELVARAVHRLGPRRERGFCALNCAALADDLIEAELFGYARGAFTGAAAERRGLFEEADEGTLFLDEVGELSARAQAKLLRAIQEREIRRIGENFSRRVDVRIIAATNRALAGEAAAGRFRRDLLYRLDVVRIVVPPLRGRVEDIPLLATRFWTRALAYTGSRATLDPATLAALARYDWPGNVRELENVMAALAVQAPRRGRIGPAALPQAIAGAATAATASTLDEARHHFERRFVRAALARAGGHRGRAARDLGVSRQGLAKLMARLGLAQEGDSGHVD